MYNPFSLQGKKILVTGASSGIGQGVAIACSKMGATVVLNGRNQERLQDTFSQMDGTGHVIIPSDLSEQEGIDDLVTKCPSINGVVHCAGIPRICPLKHMKRSVLNEIINTNEVAPILLTAGLLKKGKLQKGSSIVFVASVAGVFTSGCIGDTNYSATKGSLSGFTMTAARELGGQEMRVNTICPATVETPILKQALTLATEEDIKKQLADYALKRFGKPEDIANAAIYLLSDASSWVTGINLAVDGGCHL